MLWIVTIDWYKSSKEEHFIAEAETTDEAIRHCIGSADYNSYHASGYPTCMVRPLKFDHGAAYVTSVIYD